MGTEDLLKPGDRVADRYVVNRPLAKGGMGAVFVATHEDLGTEVALKVLASAPGNEAVAARFLREARAAARLKSEHIARVTDFGVLPSGHPFMVMELLTGIDLDAVVAKGVMDPQVAVDHILQACEGIAVAHAAGIVHRDIKPSNLFVASYPDGSPLVKVLDFGIAKETDSKLTGDAMGSPYYMSPEQARGGEVDSRADIWSLGVTLFELLSGKRPFEASMALQVCVMIMSNPPTRLESLRPDLPPGLVDVIHKCLEKDPADRPASVGQLATMLRPYASATGALNADRVIRMAGGNVSMPEIEPSSVREARARQSDTVLVATGTPPPTTSRKPVWLALGAVAVVAAIVGFVVFRAPRTQSTPQSVAAATTHPTASATSTVPSAPTSVEVVVPAPSASTAMATPSATATTTAVPTVRASSTRPAPTHTVKRNDGTETRK